MATQLEQVEEASELFSVLETGFTSSEAAQMLGIPEKAVVSASEFGRFKKSLWVCNRTGSPFTFHNYFDVVEFALNQVKPFGQSGNSDHALCVSDFLDEWAAFIELRMYQGCSGENKSSGHEDLTIITQELPSIYKNWLLSGQLLLCNSKNSVEAERTERRFIAVACLIYEKAQQIYNSEKSTSYHYGFDAPLLEDQVNEIANGGN